MNLKVTKISDQATPALHSIRKALGEQDRKLILTELATKFQSQTKSNFGLTGKYRSDIWNPLSNKYAKKVGSSIPTLLRSGALERSIQVGQYQYGFISVYCDSIYGAAHTFGSATTNLPSRNFWPVQFMGSPYFARLIPTAEKEMQTLIIKRLSTLSEGYIPSTIGAMDRYKPEYSNPFTPPQKP